LGKRKAATKASATGPVPTNLAIRTSLRNPRIRLTKVSPDTVIIARNIRLQSALFIPNVQCLIEGGVIGLSPEGCAAQTVHNSGAKAYIADRLSHDCIDPLSIQITQGVEKTNCGLRQLPLARTEDLHPSPVMSLKIAILGLSPVTQKGVAFALFRLKFLRTIMQQNRNLRRVVGIKAPRSRWSVISHPARSRDFTKLLKFFPGYWARTKQPKDGALLSHLHCYDRTF
tara:strand:+ start:694 stop:1377 length:684 start_codon:yes stop_codon:yes gene_type:complete